MTVEAPKVPRGVDAVRVRTGGARSPVQNCLSFHFKVEHFGAVFNERNKDADAIAKAGGSCLLLPHAIYAYVHGYDNHRLGGSPNLLYKPMA